MNWIYNEEPIEVLPIDIVGFVYKITNLIDGRIYFGKKKSHFAKTSLKTVTLKSGIRKKKKIRSQVESDWKTYFGSSEELKKDVLQLGEENFKREILRFCNSLSSLSYYEIKVQLEYDVLLYPSLYYNAYVGCRINRTHMIGNISSLGINPNPISSNVLPFTSTQE